MTLTRLPLFLFSSPPLPLFSISTPTHSRRRPQVRQVARVGQDRRRHGHGRDHRLRPGEEKNGFSPEIRRERERNKLLGSERASERESDQPLAFSSPASPTSPNCFSLKKKTKKTRNSPSSATSSTSSSPRSAPRFPPERPTASSSRSRPPRTSTPRSRARSSRSTTRSSTTRRRSTRTHSDRAG